MGVVRRHLPDAGINAPHRLDLRLRGHLAPLFLVGGALCPSHPCPRPGPDLPVRGGPRQHLPPCPRAPSLPLVPGSCAPPAAYHLARVPYRAPYPPSRRRCLSFCRVPAPLRRCSRPGPSPVPAPPHLLPVPLPVPGTCPLPPPPATFQRLPSVPCPVSPRFALRPARSSSPSAAHSAISMPPVPLVPCLDHAMLQLRQRALHWRAFGRRGANGPWPPLGEGGLGRIRLGRAPINVAGSGVGAVLGALPALCNGCGSPLRLARRSALGRHRAHPARQWRTGGCSPIGLSGGCGPMRPVRRRVLGPTCGRGSRGSSLGGGGGLPGRHRLGGRQFGVAGGRFGLPSCQPDGNHVLRQPPLLPLCGPFPRASWADGVGGAGPVVAAVLPLGGASRVRHTSYSVRRAWLQVCLSYYLPVRRWRAVGGAVWCRRGGGGGGSWW